MIIANVQKRRFELEQYSEDLERLKSEYNNAIQADENYQGSAESEAQIKEFRRKIEPKITSFEQFEAEKEALLTNKFEIWTLEECLIIYTQEIKIREITKFRLEIEEIMEQLRQAIADVEDLNSALLAQNLHNAIGLYEAKLKELRRRAVDIKDLFSKIKKAGTDMDGNHTDDEIDFVEALAEEMPTVDKEM
jgi:hypothetical protein